MYHASLRRCTRSMKVPFLTAPVPKNSSYRVPHVHQKHVLKLPIARYNISSTPNLNMVRCKGVANEWLLSLHTFS